MDEGSKRRKCIGGALEQSVRPLKATVRTDLVVGELYKYWRHFSGFGDKSLQSIVLSGNLQSAIPASRVKYAPQSLMDYSGAALRLDTSSTSEHAADDQCHS